jgi:hypothetical protein
MFPAYEALASDLARVFGARLKSVVGYGRPDREGAHALALVDRVTFGDLAALAPLATEWRRAGLAVPLILGREEFVRSLDVFPLEYGSIIADHVVISGASPFDGCEVSTADLRRACELQVKSHLIHLREGFLERAGNQQAIARLVAGSAPAFRTLLANLNRLDPSVDERAGISDAFVREIETAADNTIADPSPLVERYINAVERLWRIVDGWRQ